MQNRPRLPIVCTVYPQAFPETFFPTWRPFSPCYSWIAHGFRFFYGSVAYLQPPDLSRGTLSPLLKVPFSRCPRASIPPGCAVILALFSSPDCGFNFVFPTSSNLGPIRPPGRLPSPFRACRQCRRCLPRRTFFRPALLRGSRSSPDNYHESWLVLQMFVFFPVPDPVYCTFEHTSFPGF